MTGAGHRVCQVFCSALPVAYASRGSPSSDWEAFAKTVLEGVFEATLAVGALLAAVRQDRVTVYLSAVGGGAFGNPSIWVANAIRRALGAHCSAPLDVKFVHFASLPRGTYAALASGDWQVRT